jgi:hypothetical protein
MISQRPKDKVYSQLPLVSPLPHQVAILVDYNSNQPVSIPISLLGCLIQIILIRVLPQVERMGCQPRTGLCSHGFMYVLHLR